MKQMKIPPINPNTIQRLNGKHIKDLDDMEGITERLQHIQKLKEKRRLNIELLKRKSKKLYTKKNQKYGRGVIRIISPKDIYFGESNKHGGKCMYFFSYCKIINDEIYGVTEYFDNYENALNTLLDTIVIQTQGATQNVL